MMRLRFWQHEPESDALDPELLSIFATSTHPPTLDPARLARSRARVAAQLRPEPATGGWLGRRLAYGLAGGGSVWGTVLGTAAAHKAATAIGIGVLLASGATAEMTGIGPAVREAVSPSHSSSEPADTTESADEAALEVTTEQAGNGATVSEAPEGLPGNLMASLRPDGSFTLRGVLVGATAEMIDVQTSLDDVPLEFALDGAVVRLPGPGSAAAGPNADGDALTIEDFEGYVVLISGRCETVDGLLTEDCVLTLVTVLGNAGQGAPPDGAGQPENPGQGNTPEGVGQPENPGQPAGAGQPEGTGQLEGVGQPDDVPRNN